MEVIERFTPLARSLAPSAAVAQVGGLCGCPASARSVWRSGCGFRRLLCTDRVDVEALLIRPDGCVAWALPTGQDLDATTLVRALGTWFGQPA
ncbi:hypothetical protein [Streptomyces sp. NPDC002962]|uniref:aromatic-ring hydroxylase C-terminal domain-containing protein n=1 Tax=Streptomyces sp. NPDC002962 TaxID=3364674 RepID=UPI003691E0F3